MVVSDPWRCRVTPGTLNKYKPGIARWFGACVLTFLITHHVYAQAHCGIGPPDGLYGTTIQAMVGTAPQVWIQGTIRTVMHVKDSDIAGFVTRWVLYEVEVRKAFTWGQDVRVRQVESAITGEKFLEEYFTDEQLIKVDFPHKFIHIYRLQMEYCSKECYFGQISRKVGVQPWAAGDNIVLPLEPDPWYQKESDFKVFKLPVGVYYRIASFGGTGDEERYFPWSLQWSKTFMEGFAQYVDMLEEVQKLPQEERGAFWLKQLSPTNNFYVRREALWWLCELKYEPAVPRIALALTEYAEGWHRDSTMQYMARRISSFPAEIWISYVEPLATHSDPRVRCEAIDLLLTGLGKITDEEKAIWLSRFWDDPDDEVRRNMVRLAADIGKWELVEKATRDKSDKVRDAARELLKKRQQPAITNGRGGDEH
mgnify:CR=1 FL=1